MGLIDVNQLINTKKTDPKHDYDKKVAGLKGENHAYDEKVAGENGELAGSKRGQNAPQNGGVVEWFKAFNEQGFTLLFRERSSNRYIGVIAATQLKLTHMRALSLVFPSFQSFTWFLAFRNGAFINKILCFFFEFFLSFLYFFRI
jgi:hypothetical protein